MPAPQTLEQCNNEETSISIPESTPGCSTKQNAAAHAKEFGTDNRL